MPIKLILVGAFFFLRHHSKRLSYLFLAVIAALLLALAISKIYQNWDRDPDRGAIGITDGAFGESYDTPIYLDQGWSESDSLWFYNTTQGSALMPYDLFLSLEQADANELFRSDHNMDAYRYLPQKPTFFNPDGLPVGFARETYQGKDYVGFTCAACHTGQINYEGTAIRIDGGPAMADMAGFLHGLEKALFATLEKPDKRARFVDTVLELDNDYRQREQVVDALDHWSHHIQLYNTVNHSHVEYGYGRLDAFGRIYNRVLQHVLNRRDVYAILRNITSPAGRPILSRAEIEQVLDGIGDTLIRDEEFVLITERLQSSEPGYPGLTQRDMLRIRNAIFNEPNAPVSYPFLWDITRADYVQWNALAGNQGLGPLGRNTGEVIGVFAKLDWDVKDPGFSFSGWITGQSKKQKEVTFESSINLFNLERLENHLRSLTSPQWPEDLLGEIDREKAERGRLIYRDYCQSCHQLIERDAWDRRVVSQISSLEHIGTDPAMAENSVRHTGRAGNFAHTYQNTQVGKVIIEQEAPVVELLTAVTTGAVATPASDKNILRRWGEWLYSLGGSFFDNDIEGSIKAGSYNPDTTAEPYASLLAYRARPLNGIWATAPYLHNGSVPTLHDLLLPKKRPDDPDDGHYRPDDFVVGSREFDPRRVGLRHQGYQGSRFTTDRRGDLNTGHEYGAGRTAQPDGTVLPALSEQERWDLVEYLKTL